MRAVCKGPLPQASRVERDRQGLKGAIPFGRVLCKHLVSTAVPVARHLIGKGRHRIVRGDDVHLVQTCQVAPDFKDAYLRQSLDGGRSCVALVVA